MMDDISKSILAKLHVDAEHIEGMLIPRETLLNESLYQEIYPTIRELKKVFSSSYMTSLQECAKKTQRWPLLNLVRQILHYYNYIMKPVRKSAGYTSDGVKKFRRFFLIEKKESETDTGMSEETKAICVDGMEKESM